MQLDPFRQPSKRAVGPSCILAASASWSEIASCPLDLAAAARSVSPPTTIPRFFRGAYRSRARQLGCTNLEVHQRLRRERSAPADMAWRSENNIVERLGKRGPRESGTFVAPHGCT